MTTDEWIAELKSITVAELHERVLAIEEAFGIPLLPWVMGSDGKQELLHPAPEPVDAWSVILTEVGPRKFNVVKAIRSLANTGLREAKAMVDGTPYVLAVGLRLTVAGEWVAALEATGATVKLENDDDGHIGALVPA